jgi:hypothetical protein
MNKALSAVIALGVAGLSSAQSGVVYGPFKSIDEQGISLAGWGSGTISQTDEAKLEGSYSLRVTTRNLFQGGLIRFAHPVDLANEYGTKSNLLRITLAVPTTGVTVSGGGGAGDLGGGGGKGGGLPGLGNAGGGGGGQSGALGQAGGGQGGGQPATPPTGKGGGGALGGAQGNTPGLGAPGKGNTGGATQPSTTPALTTVRFVITTTDGLKSEVRVPIADAAGKDGWRSVAIPLQSISGFGRTNKIIKEIGISGDALSTFYIGDIRTLSDETPITGELLTAKDFNLALNDTREFRAAGYGGASVLRYTWDFDASDGIQVDAEGPVVTKKFRKAGDYVVTLTISDAAGLKKPWTTTFKVRVNP